MDSELYEDELAELDEGVPFLFGLMLALLFSLGLWMSSWWIALLIRH
jgi:hypothetical protein